jgi:hypothetical protein
MLYDINKTLTTHTGHNLHDREGAATKRAQTKRLASFGPSVNYLLQNGGPRHDTSRASGTFFSLFPLLMHSPMTRSRRRPSGPSKPTPATSTRHNEHVVITTLDATTRAPEGWKRVQEGAGGLIWATRGQQGSRRVSRAPTCVFFFPSFLFIDNNYIYLGDITTTPRRCPRRQKRGLRRATRGCRTIDEQREDIRGSRRVSSPRWVFLYHYRIFSTNKALLHV